MKTIRRVISTLSLIALFGNVGLTGAWGQGISYKNQESPVNVENSTPVEVSLVQDEELVLSKADRINFVVHEFSVLDKETGLSLNFLPAEGMLLQTHETAFGSQTLFTAHDETESKFTFEVKIVSGEQPDLTVANDGSIMIRVGDVFVGALTAPWAFDNNGLAVPTHFEIDGALISQVLEVDQSTAYPVVADPSLLTVVGCITTLGFAGASLVASGGMLTAADAVAVALCAAAIESDRAAVAKYREEVVRLTNQLSVIQSEIARLQAGNGEFARVLNDPRASASAKAYARSQISYNNTLIASKKQTATAIQSNIDSLNAQIADLSFWP